MNFLSISVDEKSPPFGVSKSVKAQSFFDDVLKNGVVKKG